MKKAFLILFVIGTIQVSAQNETCNCCSEKYGQFDFWIGSWEVTNPDGSAAGDNVIEQLQDNCLLREHWISATPGITGTSHSFYNATTNQWEQIWVDNQGGSLHLKGNRVDNKMILITEVAKNQNGEPFFHRVTWIKNDDGSVRQYWETITNDKDIVVAFDGLYRKKK